MRYAVEVYAQLLLGLAASLVGGLMAVLGSFLMARAYCALRAPRLGLVSKGAHSDSAFERWAVLVVGFGAAAYGWTMVGAFTAERLVANLPGGLWVVAVLAVVVVFPLGMAAYSIMASYRSFRQWTDFRVWIRGLGARGPVAVHEYYLAGRRYRAVGEMFSVLVLYGWLLVLVRAGHALHSGERRMWILAGAVAAVAITVSLVRVAVLRLWVVLRPEYGLADLCTNPKAFAWDEGARFVVHRPGGWRGRVHRSSFKIADLVEWSVRRAQGRYAQHHYDEIALAARRLAQSMRMNALRVEVEGEAGVTALEERKFLALQLTTGRDPIEFVDRVAAVTFDEPEPPELPRRRAARAVEAVSNAINFHWPAMKVVVVVAVIALLVASGKLVDAAGLLK